jgi:hypothetical protein
MFIKKCNWFTQKLNWFTQRAQRAKSINFFYTDYMREVFEFKKVISRRARRGADKFSQTSAPLRPLREINSCVKQTFAPLRSLREISFCVK